MVDFTLLGRLYFRIDALHNSFSSFIFGLSFSSVPQEFLYINEDESEETVFIQETGINIWLGIISVHFGWRGD